jgi:hypothetical protein
MVWLTIPEIAGALGITPTAGSADFYKDLDVRYFRFEFNGHKLWCIIADPFEGYNGHNCHNVMITWRPVQLHGGDLGIVYRVDDVVSLSQLRPLHEVDDFESLLLLSMFSD